MVLHLLLASYNRKAKTLACLKSLKAQKGLPQGLLIRTTLFDDGSADGTPEAVRRAKLADSIVLGDGNYYWGGAMRALIEGVRGSKKDLILLLNDDVVLRKDALARLFETRAWALSKNKKDPIVVGSMRAKAGPVTTWGGITRVNAWHPIRFKVLEARPFPQPCDSFNANCVLVPKKVMDDLGGLDGGFTHVLGDFDLGLRAKALGVPLWVAPGFLGACDLNPPVPKADTLRGRWKSINHPKGFPPWEYLRFSRRHGGIFWPYFWVTPIVKRLLP